MSAILPEEEQDEFPTGFSIVGHVGAFCVRPSVVSPFLPQKKKRKPKSGQRLTESAHLNLRDEFLPYKHLIATVLQDKNPTVRTVINKTDDVGQANEYRTFGYELLAGDPDLNVEIHEANCTFRFDYSKVYWNSRLSSEHRRLIEMFRPGEAVCDVMAGVGPFAVPAGKKNVFVWANDLNPDSFASLDDAVRRNKVRACGINQPITLLPIPSCAKIEKVFTRKRQVHRFVKTFNQDGRTFIRSSADKLLQTTTQVKMSNTDKQASRLKQPSAPPSATKPTITSLTSPRTFSHYILNLPASAITFLPCFIGLYAGREGLFTSSTGMRLPIVHVYCFSTKSDDNKEEGIKICKQVSEQLRYEMKPGGGGGGDGVETEEEGEVRVWDVRDVAPLKRMFCASFRLPAEVAFRVT